MAQTKMTSFVALCHSVSILTSPSSSRSTFCPSSIFSKTHPNQSSFGICRSHQHSISLLIPVVQIATRMTAAPNQQDKDGRTNQRHSNSTREGERKGFVDDLLDRVFAKYDGRTMGKKSKGNTGGERSYESYLRGDRGLEEAKYEVMDDDVLLGKRERGGFQGKNDMENNRKNSGKNKDEDDLGMKRRVVLVKALVNARVASMETCGLMIRSGLVKVNNVVENDSMKLVDRVRDVVTVNGARIQITLDYRGGLAERCKKHVRSIDGNIEVDSRGRMDLGRVDDAPLYQKYNWRVDGGFYANKLKSRRR